MIFQNLCENCKAPTILFFLLENIFEICQYQLFNFKFMIFKLTTTSKRKQYKLIFKNSKWMISMYSLNEWSNSTILFSYLMTQTGFINIGDYLSNMWNRISFTNCQYFTNCHYLHLSENSFITCRGVSVPLIPRTYLEY